MLAQLLNVARFARKGDIKGVALALSEAMEATEVKNEIPVKRCHIVLIFKFYMVASEAIWQPQRP